MKTLTELVGRKLGFIYFPYYILDLLMVRNRWLMLMVQEYQDGVTSHSGAGNIHIHTNHGIVTRQRRSPTKIYSQENSNSARV